MNPRRTYGPDHLGLDQVRPGFLTDESVHGLADELGVAGVPAILLDQVASAHGEHTPTELESVLGR